MNRFVKQMRIAGLSEITIGKRVELIERLKEFLGDVPLIDATTDMLEEWQATYNHLAPASKHIYTRHTTAFYRWAKQAGLIDVDPAADLALPRVPKTVPHPTSFEDLKLIFAAAPPRLYTAYILATFAALRSAEICRMRSTDITYNGAPVALIHGKGGKERKVPLLPPVMAEIGYRRGWIITKNGRPVEPARLSLESTAFLKRIGCATTLHSMRATFATHGVQLTHDPLLIRDILGHESLATTEIYMESTLVGAHEKLAGFTDLFASLTAPRHLAAVSSA